jgi:hypothetical protein
MRRLLTLLTLGCCSLGVSQTTAPKREEGWRSVCELAKRQPLTPAEPKGPLKPDELAVCDETKLYYGLGERPNYAAAFQCAWHQRAHPQHTVGNMFYGPGVLTMLYANGLGVSRDYDLAIRFACENEWAAEAEMAYRVGHLERLRKSGSLGTTFDLCDDITSGLSDGVCTSIQTRTADAARAREIAALLRKLSPSANAVFPSLQAAQAAFENARVAHEVDLSGTSRGAFQLQEKAKLRDQFIDNLLQFGRNQAPSVSANDFALLDRQLNEVYQGILHSPTSKWEYGTIKPEGIRDTERKWLSLVNAWMAFARTAYPQLAATRIKAQLFRLRLQQLRSLQDN